MKNILDKKAQRELFDFLYPTLQEKLYKEYKKRDTLAESKEEQKKYITSESVVEYINERKDRFRIITLLAPVYNEMSEKEKSSFTYFTHYAQYLKDYLEDEEAFILDYNKTTDEGTDFECKHAAKKALGITRGRWSLSEELKTEIRARLSVQQIAPFGEIVEKITADININKFFENNNK